jgi:hypothetical protein
METLPCSICEATSYTQGGELRWWIPKPNVFRRLQKTEFFCPENRRFDESVTRDAATIPWAVESDSGAKIINPSSLETDALAELLTGGVQSSDSSDIPLTLDVDPAEPACAFHTPHVAQPVPRSIQQGMRSPLSAAWKDACDLEISRCTL